MNVSEILKRNKKRVKELQQTAIRGRLEVKDWPREKNVYIKALTALLKSKFYKKRGATFLYDITRKLSPLDFTQYRLQSSSFE